MPHHGQEEDKLGLSASASYTAGPATFSMGLKKNEYAEHGRDTTPYEYHHENPHYRREYSDYDYGYERGYDRPYHGQEEDKLGLSASASYKAGPATFSMGVKKNEYADHYDTTPYEHAHENPHHDSREY